MGFTVKKTGNNIIITIPLEDGVDSSTGKMKLIANSGGWTDVGESYKNKPLRMLLNFGYSNK